MHCKDISVRKVKQPIDEAYIHYVMKDWTAYKRAAYVVLNHDDQYAVIELEKSMGEGLFGKVTDYRIISLPDDTVYVERPEVDVINPSALALLQDEFPGKAVVVRGMFSHLGFVYDMKPFRLRVLDVVPPNPSKMSHLVRTALASGFVDLPIVAEYVDLDISEMSRKATTGEIMFPCEVSGTESDRPFCFLDQVPDIEGRDLTLVGCVLSKRIFSEVYGRDVPFINICPRDHVPDDGVKTIVKCCRIKNGCEIDGDVALVPWGVTVPEIVEALNALFRE